MTKVEFLLDQKAYCLRWLAIPEAERPGSKLTDAVLNTLLDQTEEALTNHIHTTASGEVVYK